MTRATASGDRAVRRASMPAGSERFLDTRSLASGHARLAALLGPGISVLDVGCGTGAITRGIAQAVAPGGEVLGIDVNAELIQRATAAASQPNLRFAVADIRQLQTTDRYDVVTAARVLQWLLDPLAALTAMVAATRPGGQVIVLDYDHTKARWEPPLPQPATRFYDAFLSWRADAGMDNAIASRLPELFARAGLRDIVACDASETITRADPDFATQIALWPGVIATRGHQIVADGMLTEPQRAQAEREIWRWARDRAQRQTLRLTAVTGTKPS